MTPHELAARLVKRYCGLPLSLDDLEDLMGVTRHQAHDIVSKLAKKGTIERFRGPDGQTLVRDPVAWRESA